MLQLQHGSSDMILLIPLDFSWNDPLKDASK